MLWQLAVFALQDLPMRASLSIVDRETLGYAVAVVREPRQRRFIDVALSAPRVTSRPSVRGEVPGSVWMLNVAERVAVRHIDGAFGFGSEVWWLGDFDYDGVPDFLVRPASGRLEGLSGATGECRWRSSELDRLAQPMDSIGDVDCDGVRDILAWSWRPAAGAETSAADRGVVLSVWSGVDGSPIVERATAGSIDLLGRVVEVADLDGDERGDFVAVNQRTAADGTQLASLVVLSSTTLHERFRIPFATRAAPVERPWIVDVAARSSDGAAGDTVVLLSLVDGDDAESAACGAVLAVDVRRGTIVWSWTCGFTGKWEPEPPSIWSGSDVDPFRGERFRSVATSSGGDVDGDGVGDVLVREFAEHVGLVARAGLLSVVSGRDGRTLRVHPGPAYPTASYPHRAEFVGDVDGDGVDDYLTTESCGLDDVAGPAEIVRFFSGRTGEELLRLP